MLETINSDKAVEKAKDEGKDVGRRAYGGNEYAPDKEDSAKTQEKSLAWHYRDEHTNHGIVDGREAYCGHIRRDEYADDVCRNKELPPTANREHQLEEAPGIESEVEDVGMEELIDESRQESPIAGSRGSETEDDLNDVDVDHERDQHEGKCF